MSPKNIYEEAEEPPMLTRNIASSDEPVPGERILIDGSDAPTTSRL